MREYNSYRNQITPPGRPSSTNSKVCHLSQDLRRRRQYMKEYLLL
jgi:hypothetical protein